MNVKVKILGLFTPTFEGVSKTGAWLLLALGVLSGLIAGVVVVWAGSNLLDILVPALPVPGLSLWESLLTFLVVSFTLEVFRK